MLRKLVYFLSFSLISTAAFAFDINDMSKEEREAFNAAVREYLLENPGVIFEAAEIYEQRQAELQAAGDVALIAQNADELFNDGRSFSEGNANGDIKIVEFLDYRCGYCKRAFNEVKALLEADRNIELIVKEFPILGEQSTLASRFAIAVRNVAGNDAYKVAHDELMTMRGAVNRAALNRIANRAGVNFAEIEIAMNDPKVNQEIAQNYALAQKLKITGTPAFVFKTEMLRGFAPMDAMAQIVARVRG